MNEFLKPGDLQKKLDVDNAPIVIDVRTPDEFAEGHIPGSVNIPLDELPDRLSEFPKERLIVPYCNMHHRGNSRGERAAQILKESGYEAHAIDGGFVEWNNTDLPVERC